MKIIYEHDGSDIHEAVVGDGMLVNNLAGEAFRLSLKLGVQVSDISMRFAVHDGGVTHKE